MNIFFFSFFPSIIKLFPKRFKRFVCTIAEKNKNKNKKEKKLIRGKFLPLKVCWMVGDIEWCHVTLRGTT